MGHVGVALVPIDGKDPERLPGERQNRRNFRQPKAGRSPAGSLNPADPPALKLLHVMGGQTSSGVEELTQGGENDGLWTSLAT
jgi:hypothetical protein